MTDDEAITLHLKLADYHDALAKAARLDVIHEFHVDLAKRLRQEGETGIRSRAEAHARVVERAKTEPVFVFGSNLAGRHGKGAALTAREWYGAIMGQGVGRQGNSYAIPTKDARLQTLRLDAIRIYVAEFIAYAAANPETEFQLTAIGCGLAGYKPADIAPMFKDAPPNVGQPREFVEARRAR